MTHYERKNQPFPMKLLIISTRRDNEKFLEKNSYSMTRIIYKFIY